MQLLFLNVVGRWRVYRDQRDAAANGAVLVPQVQEGGLSTIAALTNCLARGYPCECLHARSYNPGDILHSGYI
jgi:hypothetical protein